MVVTASRRTRAALAAAVGAVSLLVGACGSAAAPPMKPAKAKAEIERAYSTLFNFTNHSVSAKTAVIQNGGSLRAALKQALSSSLAKQATGAEVITVRLLSTVQCQEAALVSPCAIATYNLLGPTHAPLFATPSSGYAVYVNGHWLVAKATICGLLELFYSASGHKGVPSGC
ncbi:MAG TPA: hypothetical protein VK386_04475 [Acidimicrobiales bacterium]|nr:hypothetical protein [Acidimicrobiales bacterium]